MTSANQQIIDMVHLHGRKRVIADICAALNCERADVDVATGYVHIEGPQAPRWLTGDDLDALVERMNAGV